jgi:hypothetical protein
MSERSKLVTRMTENGSKFADADRMEVQELLNEIDNLALLLHEVNRYCPCSRKTYDSTIRSDNRAPVVPLYQF